MKNCVYTQLTPNGTQWWGDLKSASLTDESTLRQALIEKLWLGDCSEGYSSTELQYSRSWYSSIEFLVFPAKDHRAGPEVHNIWAGRRIQILPQDVALAKQAKQSREDRRKALQDQIEALQVDLTRSEEATSAILDSIKNLDERLKELDS